MALQVKNTELRILNMWTRMPFRYGIATLTALPHLFVKVEMEVDGRVGEGLASDGLAPKWFTKDPTASPKEEVKDMLNIIQSACSHVEAMGSVASVFDLWRQLYLRQQEWARSTSYPPLLWHFGVTLVERAVIDAYCRYKELSFEYAVRTNQFGVQPGEVHAELADSTLPSLLPQAIRRMYIRHTVGLADPLHSEEILEENRLHDGLPQALNECIDFYGLNYFKIKVPKDPDEAIDRLVRIARIVRSSCRDFAFTLDGNEFFREVQDFQVFWESLQRSDELKRFLRDGLLFVEQPWHREVALSNEVAHALAQWEGKPAIIIDESDGAIESLPRALECGYAGTSHKNCKGVLKGLLNCLLLRHLEIQDPCGRYVFSAEDLANVGPVALLQDLCAAAVMGIQHIERNGHHYFAGLSSMPMEIQRQVLEKHSDLYHAHQSSDSTFPSLTIENGSICLDSILRAPFGYDIHLDFKCFVPVNEWRFESLSSPPSDQGWGSR